MEVEEIFNALLLVGGVFMLIMSFLLWFSPKGLFPNRILAALVFSWALCVVIFSIQSRELYLKYPHVLGVGTLFCLLFFPLMYIYVRSYLYEKNRNIIKYFIHFLPFFIFIGVLSPFYFQSREAKINLINTRLPENFLFAMKLGTVTLVVLGVLYTVLSFKVVYKFEEENEGSFDVQQLKILTWLKQFLAMNTMLWAIGTSGVLIEEIGLNIHLNMFRVYYVGLTILVLGASFFNLLNPNIFAIRAKLSSKEPVKIKRSTPEKPKIIINPILSKVVDENPLDKNDAKLILDYLELDKPYLNSNVTLQDLADKTGMSKHRVSDLLNSQLGASFYDIINEYRVKEVIRLIDEGKHQQHKLLYLAELAGFNSKATFNRIFKKTTGRTPSQYIQELAA